MKTSRWIAFMQLPEAAAFPANAKSHEDLSRLIAEYPATDLFKWDISPITDFDVQSDLIIRRMNLYIEYANRRKKT